MAVTPLKDAVAGRDVKEENYEAEAGQNKRSSTGLLCFSHRARLHLNCRMLHPSPGDLSQLGSNGQRYGCKSFNGALVEGVFAVVLLAVAVE